MNKWTDEEIQLLKEYANKGLSCEEIAHLLNRTYNSVRGKRKMLHIKRWSDEDISMLKSYFEQGYNCPQVAKKMNRTLNAVQCKARAIGAIVPQNKWSKEEEAFLRASIKNGKSYKYIGSKLHKSSDAVKYKAHSLGIYVGKRCGTYRSWTDEEIDYLKRFSETRTSRQIAKVLHRTPHAIKNKCRKLSIPLLPDTGDYSFYLVSKAFGCCWETVDKWCNKYNMPARKHIKMNTKEVSAEKFWKWAVKHQNIIPWDRYVRGSIIPEPDNLKEIISNYKPEHVNTRKPITKALVIAIQNDRYLHDIPVEDLMEKYGRSRYSILAILNREVHT